MSECEKEAFDTLIGKKILALHGDGTQLAFITEDGVYPYDAAGDCCSHSWFEHISGVDNLVGHTVSEVVSCALDTVIPPQTVDEDDWGWRDIKQYGYRIVTDKGYFEIEMRNESNGYYGGAIVANPVTDNTTLPKITEDF